MDSQASTGISSLSERFGGGSRREKLRDHHKEHRLSKADIGGPIATPKNKKDTSVTDPLGASMVIRAVIIHKDDKGYGLTVSGDNPVFVQSVREDGAAHAAGVRQGDRIIKVNGTNVTEYNHIEVVKLIKSGPYVGLSLLAPASVRTDSSAVNQSIGSEAQLQSVSKPTTAVAFHDEKISLIKQMLDREKAEVERIKEEYSKEPNKKVLEDLGRSQKILQDLEKQLWKAESSKPTQDTPILQFKGGTTKIDRTSAVIEMESADVSNVNKDDSEKKTANDLTTIIDEKSPKLIDDSKTTDILFSGHDNNLGIGSIPGKYPQQQPNIINFEEDELKSEENLDHGPFLDFEKLKSRPAHVAVFLNYVFSKHEPNELLLVLIVEYYRQLSSSKEMLKVSDMICRNFLSPNSPLNVNIDEGIATSIIEATQSNAQQKNLSDDAVRSVFDPAVQHALKTVRDQLQQYCRIKEQGLGNCYGEEKLPKNVDHAQEIKAVEEILTPILQDLGQTPSESNDHEVVIAQAKTDVLEKLIVQSTGKRKSKISKFGSILRPNKPNTTVRPKTAGSVESLLDENKRLSRLNLVKRGGKKSKSKESTTSLLTNTVNTLIQPEFFGGPADSSNVSLGKVQNTSSDGSSSALPNTVETDGGSDKLANDNSIAASGVYGKKKQRTGTTKSISDPDVVSVEKSISNAGSFDSQTSTNTTNASSINGSVAGSTSSYSLASVSSEDMFSLTLENYPELDVEPEYQWSSTTPKEVLKKLDKKEIKRQEIINELLHTEQHHVRDLLILELLFYNHMMSEGGLSQEELFSVFPNLQKILEIHRRLKNALIDLKTKDGYVVETISGVLLETFDGEEGEQFKNECAKYCGNQTAALEFIKEKCRKEQKFNLFIQNAERHPKCRRLQLKDFVPMEFQRLTKYPLLLENIIKNSKKEEASRLQHVQKQCKAILSYVNKVIKDAEDYQKVVEIQKNLDSSAFNKTIDPLLTEYKNINLTERKLVHQGPLTWRITQGEKKKSVVLHCLLFEDILVLLQKQDERYVLKFHMSTTLTATKDLKSTVQPPILKLSDIYVRIVATDKKAFFLISTGLYELVAATAHDAQEWFKVTQSAVDAAKKRNTANTRRDAFIVTETSRNLKPDSAPTAIPDEKEFIATGGQDDILKKIEKKNEEIAAALVEKHNLLASYAGVEEEDLDNLIDMTSEDSDAEPDMLILQLLTYAESLNVALKDALCPDTVFLSSTSQSILVPMSDVGEGTPVNSETNIEQDLTTPKIDINLMDLGAGDLSWTTSDSRVDTEQGDSNISSATDIVSSDALEPLDNTSLEGRMSDYETASETASPSHSIAGDHLKIEDEFHSENEATPSLSLADGKSQAEQDGDQVLLHDNSDTSASNPGIQSSESNLIVGSIMESEQASLANQSSPVEKLISPAPFDNVNLVDFDAQANSPGIASTMPSDKHVASVMSHCEPVDISKMLGITQQLESQLLVLLKKIKKNTQDKQQLMEENDRLVARLREAESKLISVSNKESDNSITSGEGVLNSQKSDGTAPLDDLESNQ